MWLRVQLLVAAAACVAVEFLAVFERNARKGPASPCGTQALWLQIVTPACAGLGSLVDDLLEQIGAGLGECELAEARIDGSEVGVDDLVESVVLHDVSFRSAWRRVSVFLFIPLAAAVSLCLLSIFFSSFFCCALILRRANRQCHATIVTSFVKSSANLEEKVTFAENWRTHLIVHILCVSCWL